MEKDWKVGDLTEVKPGDLVFCTRPNHRCWLKVLSTTYEYEGPEYPIEIAKGGGLIFTSTIMGRHHKNDKYPSYYTWCPLDPPVPKPVERPGFEVDHLVWVKGESPPMRHWIIRCFGEWPDDPSDGSICTWNDGKTSKEKPKPEKTFWPYWKDAECGSKG